MHRISPLSLFWKSRLEEQTGRADWKATPDYIVVTLGISVKPQGAQASFIDYDSVVGPTWISSLVQKLWKFWSPRFSFCILRLIRCVQILFQKESFAIKPGFFDAFENIGSSFMQHLFSWDLLESFLWRPSSCSFLDTAHVEDSVVKMIDDRLVRL